MILHTRRTAKRVPDKMNTRSKTETTGYAPQNLIIKEMQMAGQRLQDYREKHYDFNGTDIVPDDFIDPTRNSNFDLADGTRISRELKKKADTWKQDRKAQEKGPETENTTGKSSPESVPGDEVTE